MRQLLLLTVCSFLSSSNLQLKSLTRSTLRVSTSTQVGKQTKDGVVIFSTLNEQKATYAMITLYGSGESSCNVKNDFNSELQQFVVGQLGIKRSPQIERVRNTAGGPSSP